MAGIILIASSILLLLGIFKVLKWTLVISFILIIAGVISGIKDILKGEPPWGIAGAVIIIILLIVL